MSWCFAIVNNRLAEIYFDKTKKGPKIWGHCYVKRSDYKSRKEQYMIKEDTTKVSLVYRHGEYKDKKRDLVEVDAQQGIVKLLKKSRQP